MNLRRFTLAAFVLVAFAIPAFAADRPLATWPPQPGPLRVIIDTDAANEVDDQYALALALGFPDRLKLEGFVAAHFGDGGGADGIDKSQKEIETVLAKAGLAGTVPIKRGVMPFQPDDAVPDSDGIQFILERARSATPQEPLWLVALGPATDAAAVLLKQPEIADRMIIVWHGRSEWPASCRNFNARNDPAAARLLFELPCRLVLFDTGAHLTMPLAESQRRLVPHGALGGYLHEIRGRNPHWLEDKKGMYDLGDIAALVEPESASWEVARAPAVREDLSYDFAQDRGPIVRIHDVNRHAAFHLLERALERLHATRAEAPGPLSNQ